MRILFLFVLISSTAFADYNINHRLGFSGAGGWTHPWTGNDFDEVTEGNFYYGLWGDYAFSESSSIQAGYSRYSWRNNATAARVYDATYMYRFLPENRWRPLLGAGIGIADVANYNVDENWKLALRARVGMEYAATPDLYVKALIDYQYVGNMPGEEGPFKIGDMHIFAPQIMLTYFIYKH